MSIFSRDFLSKFWRFVVPFAKLKMYIKCKQDKKNIIIHTPGKVGSTSAYVTLKNILGETHNVFHFHYMSNEAMNDMVEKHLTSERKSIPLHLIMSKEFTKMFNIKTENIQIVVLIREPISRFLSAKFQNLNMYYKDWRQIDAQAVERLILEGLENDEHLSDLYWWFDKEIKSNFNIDVFKDDDLEYSQDYWCFKRNNIDVYIIKMEKLSEVFSKFCERELGLSHVELINSNVGEKKSYSTMYRDIKKRMQIPQEILDKSGQSLFVKRFYNS